ncbi:MAG: glucokinase [Candidatus Eisenbacteria bacterium]|nr:glucokinase [Candidatus Eisenbacteria bacterium]
MIVLAGDVGGTKTDLALVSRERGVNAPLAEATYLSRQYANLEMMVAEFLACRPHRPDRVILGVAGPVVAGRARVTNLPWVIDDVGMRRCTGAAEVCIMNDLEAIAWAIPGLEAADLRQVNPGTAEAGGAVAVVAPGTGLGEALLIWDGARYRARPSEGGHTDFGPRNEREIRLLQWLMGQYRHASYERVCSGMAIPDLYRFVRQSGVTAHPAVAADLARAADPTPVIVDAAMAEDNPCPACRDALAIFASVLGAEAGNLALKVLATGGVYLAGGLPRRILPLLLADDFRVAFSSKGRFSDLVGRIPVHVVLNPKAGLLGAMAQGLEDWAGAPASNHTL